MVASKTRITTMLRPRNQPVVPPRLQNKRGKVSGMIPGGGLDPLNKDWGFLVDDQKLQMFKKRRVLVFPVDKRVCKICHTREDEAAVNNLRDRWHIP